MEGELERYENGGYRGQHSRCCVTLWEKHHRGGDKYTRRAAGYHKAGNKIAGDEWTAGTGKSPGEWMTPGRVEWGRGYDGGQSVRVDS